VFLGGNIEDVAQSFLNKQVEIVVAKPLSLPYPVFCVSCPF